MRKRAYIIGNGPSLAKTNLEFFIGTPSFACNRIHLMYDKTDWRPTHYVRSEWHGDSDPVRRNEGTKEIQMHLDMGIPVFASDHWGVDGIEIIKHCHEHQCNFDDPHAPSEWHLPYPCVFGGSVSMAMQLAYLEGYNEQILVGCDLLYHDNPKQRASHFDPAYELGGEQSAYYANNNAFWGHVCVVNSIGRKKVNLQVYNGTIGGDLHIYPRLYFP